MKKAFYYTSNLALFLGVAVVAYVVYASFHHQMSWAKLMLFWVGGSAIAYFLLYRILARVETFRGGRSVRKYKFGYRVFCALLLSLGLFGAFSFGYLTWSAWQQPALYWELLAEQAPAPGQYQVSWLMGNQRYERAMKVHEIQLRELAHVMLENKGGNLTLACKVDSQQLPVTFDETARVHHFLLPDSFTLPALDNRTVQFQVEFRQRFAVYEISALYDVVPPSGNANASPAPPKSLAISEYLVVDPPYAERMDFPALARKVHQPSAHTREALIGALGRSHHPMALNCLIELLQIRDPRVQNAVCQALAELGDSRATPALIRLARETQSAQAVRALGHIASREGINFLIEILTDGSREPFLRATAANVIGEARLKPAVPTLVALLKQNSAGDAALQREALVALARMDRRLATDLAIEITQVPVDDQVLHAVLEVMPELEHERFLPVLARWLSSWRSYNLTTDELQTILNYVVTNDHRDMVGVLVEALQREQNAETQFLFVEALTRLAGRDFGQIQFPVLNSGTFASNRRVINTWGNWWGRARRDPLYLDQITPSPLTSKI